ncbi:MAG: DUF1573 domain-containing protein [Bacteroidaceae bacterium]|nr:DUF1573 domain-containing protein [Bacteroidaceae bacterium]
MNRIISTITAFIICIAATAQTNKSPIQFHSYEHNFGTIEEKDGIVQHTYLFMNITDKPVTISTILTSCGCTTASYSTEPLEPGEIGELTVNFNPAGTEGEVIRELEVFTNQGKSIDRLLLMANVIPTPLGLEEQYPRTLAEGIRVATLRCNFGFLEQGNTQSNTIILANIGTETRKIRIENSNKESYLTIEPPTAIKQQTVESVNVTYSIPSGKNIYGTLRDTLWVYADDVKSKEPLIVTAIITDHFDDTDSEEPKPSIRIEPSLVDLGIKPANRLARGTFLVENTGKADLIIRDVETLERCTNNLNNGTVLKPGESRTVSVSLPVPEETGKTVMASINITSNDPVRPFREIRVQVKSK